MRCGSGVWRDPIEKWTSCDRESSSAIWKPVLPPPTMAHFPSGRFYANAAWTVLAAIAHNLLRWTELLGLPDGPIRAARTVRRRLLQLPGRLVSHAGRFTLRLPARWPWQTEFIEALTRIRALPAAA